MKSLLKRNPNRSALSRNIRRLCQSRGLLQGQLANCAGITQGHLSLIMGGRVSKPREETIQKLAYALGCQLVELYGKKAKIILPK